MELVDNATIPVINGLTDDSHPCQALAGVLMIKEEFGTLDNIKISWIGDGNNVVNSWIQAATRFGFEIAVATPKGYEPKDEIARAKQENCLIEFTDDPKAAVRNANVVVTDTWVSMNHTDRPKRLRDFQNFQVTQELMDLAKPNAVFSHCLPCHRGEEVSSAVIDGIKSRVWQEAENRIYVQMAILLYCFGIKYE